MRDEVRFCIYNVLLHHLLMTYTKHQHISTLRMIIYKSIIAEVHSVQYILHAVFKMFSPVQADIQIMVVWNVTTYSFINTRTNVLLESAASVIRVKFFF